MLASFIWRCLSVLLRLFIGEHFHETVHQAFCRVGRFFFARRFFSARRFFFARRFFSARLCA